MRDFARSLHAADLALATRRGYAADLGRFRVWIADGRGEAVGLRRITAVDLANYRQHLIRSEKLRAASVNRKYGETVHQGSLFHDNAGSKLGL